MRSCLLWCSLQFQDSLPLKHRSTGKNYLDKLLNLPNKTLERLVNLCVEIADAINGTEQPKTQYDYANARHYYGYRRVRQSFSYDWSYDEENDDAYLQRHYIQVRTSPTSGNVYYYLSWALEISGMG